MVTKRERRLAMLFLASLLAAGFLLGFLVATVSTALADAPGSSSRTCRAQYVAGREPPTSTLAPCDWNGKWLHRNCWPRATVTALPVIHPARRLCVVTW